MKRMQLFEFEDFGWFPVTLRSYLTRYLQMMHRLLDSAPNIAKVLDGLLKHGAPHEIVDLCSGSGGPMIEVHKIAKSTYGHDHLKLTLTDLHPDPNTIVELQIQNDPTITYHPQPLHASQDDIPSGIRTLICGLHHFNPHQALKILKHAQDRQQWMLIYEISDNSYPKWLWWTVLPFTIISVLIFTPLVRPFRWQQLVFTYLIPILPLVIAWDGAASNARTYTLDDLDTLISEIKTEDYHWHHGTIPGKGGPKIFLVGTPVTHQFTPFDHTKSA